MPRSIVRIGAVLVAVVILLPGTPAPGAPDDRGTSPRPGRECTIVGTPRDDQLRGTPGRDVICGRGGNDKIVGLGGHDVLVGGGGSDSLLGGVGDDTLIGGAGRDRLVGQAGRDRLVAGAGDDTLDGGPQRDELDGGPGFNHCSPDRVDETRRCTIDEAKPVVRRTVFAASGVDVTTGPATLTVRVRASDDDQVSEVGVYGVDSTWYPGTELRLVSGTRSSGWWEGTLRFSRYAPAGSYVPRVSVRDRLGRFTKHVLPVQAIEVRNDDPDVEHPVVTSFLAPLPTTTVDLRTRSQDVVFKVRVTDAQSGVSQVRFTLLEPPHPNGQHRWVSAEAHRVSGTPHDGVWKATVPLRKGMLGGAWTTHVLVGDVAHEPTREVGIYEGPDVGHRHHGTTPGVRVIPDGRGGFEVLGATASDTLMPTVSGAFLSPATVDTRSGAAEVAATVQVRDDGRVDWVVAMLYPAERGMSEVPQLASTRMSLVAGSRRDGTWSGRLTLPRETPPGRYLLWVAAADSQLNEDVWAPPGFPGTWEPRLDTDPAVVVVG